MAHQQHAERKREAAREAENKRVQAECDRGKQEKRNIKERKSKQAENETLTDNTAEESGRDRKGEKIRESVRD